MAYSLKLSYCLEKLLRRSGSDSDEVYEVEKILDNRDSQYLVKWVGYGPEANTWEPVENLLNYKEHLNTFHQVTLTSNNSTTETVWQVYSYDDTGDDSYEVSSSSYSSNEDPEDKDEMKLIQLPALKSQIKILERKNLN